MIQFSAISPSPRAHTILKTYICLLRGFASDSWKGSVCVQTNALCWSVHPTTEQTLLYLLAMPAVVVRLRGENYGVDAICFSALQGGRCCSGWGRGRPSSRSQLTSLDARAVNGSFTDRLHDQPKPRINDSLFSFHSPWAGRHPR